MALETAGLRLSFHPPSNLIGGHKHGAGHRGPLANKPMICSMQPTPYATWLTSQMETHGLSKFDLAGRLKTGSGTIENWFSQKRIGPDADHCRQLAELFGIPPEEALSAAGYRTPRHDDNDAGLARRTISPRG